MRRSRFIPDYYFDTVYEITPDMLKELGIRGVILDIDNTLVPYEIPEPTEEVRAWLSGLWEAGIKTAFVSTFHRYRVDLSNNTLGRPAFFDSGKPSKKSCRSALKALDTPPEETAIIGDQVFTDVLAGGLAGLGIRILVKPIKDKTSMFFRFKRLLEKPVIRSYHRKNRKRNSKK